MGACSENAVSDGESGSVNRVGERRAGIDADDGSLARDGRSLVGRATRRDDDPDGGGEGDEGSAIVCGPVCKIGELGVGRLAV